MEGGGRGKLEFCETEQKDDIFYIKMKLKNKNKKKNKVMGYWPTRHSDFMTFHDIAA